MLLKSKNQKIYNFVTNFSRLWLKVAKIKQNWIKNQSFSEFCFSSSLVFQFCLRNQHFVSKRQHREFLIEGVLNFLFDFLKKSSISSHKRRALQLVSDNFLCFSINSIKLHIDMLYSVKNFSRLVNVSADCDMCERTCPVFCGEFSPKVDKKLFDALDSGQSNLPEGENLGDIELMPKRPELLPFSDSVGLSRSGLTLFSFCRRLQYQTRTTSFSM